ncbi:MAG: SDR family oxidoreductase [Desulfosalsimonadaceae bacterium]|nr:SDR family oxidoreductase [Desulfosalsimonadaceae bacterium]
MKLKEKTAIVTGAGRGLGREIARAFAEEGARVALMDRDAGWISKTADIISEIGGESLVCAGDVSKEQDVLEMVRLTRQRFGPVDILVNNAAIIGPGNFMKDADTETWKKTLDINLNGAFYCCRAVIPDMAVKKRGKILNITSGLGERPFPRFCAYGVSKAGMIQLTRSLSEELKELGIQVNAINPGVMNTPMQAEIRAMDIASVGQAVHDRFQGFYDNGQLQDPGDLASLAVFLVSGASDHMTGLNHRPEEYAKMGWRP